MAVSCEGCARQVCTLGVIVVARTPWQVLDATRAVYAPTPRTRAVSLAALAPQPSSRDSLTTQGRRAAEVWLACMHTAMLKQSRQPYAAHWQPRLSVDTTGDSKMLKKSPVPRCAHCVQALAQRDPVRALSTLQRELYVNLDEPTRPAPSRVLCVPFASHALVQCQGSFILCAPAGAQCPSHAAIHHSTW